MMVRRGIRATLIIGLSARVPQDKPSRKHPGQSLRQPARPSLPVVAADKIPPISTGAIETAVRTKWSEDGGDVIEAKLQVGATDKIRAAFLTYVLCVSPEAALTISAKFSSQRGMAS